MHRVGILSLGASHRHAWTAISSLRTILSSSGSIDATDMTDDGLAALCLPAPTLSLLLTVDIMLFGADETSGVALIDVGTWVLYAFPTGLTR